MSFPVADLHCDLPIFLALAEVKGEARTIYDRQCRCSVPQMREGGVAFQALALFTPPMAQSAEFGLKQAETLSRALDENRDVLRWVRSTGELDAAEDDRIGVMVAVEGGSTFANEGEPLADALARFGRFADRVGPLLYVGLTWVAENRFGGGNSSEKGLKPDGRVLLEYLGEHGIPVDLSHASPRLAHDIVDFIYARDLASPILASHSPYAGILELPRNLPDEIAKEIATREGVIGLNVMCRYVVGEAPQAFVDQVAHARELGVLGAQAFGADFFNDLDVPPEFRNDDDPDFFAEFGDSGCYPRILEALREGLGLSDSELEAIAHGNAFRFIRRVLGDP